MCKGITPKRVGKEFVGTPSMTPGEAVRFFNEQAIYFSEGAKCSTGTCVGYWRDRKNEDGSTPGMRKYSAELYCACKRID